MKHRSATSLRAFGKRVLWILALTYLALLLALFFGQRFLMYHPVAAMGAPSDYHLRNVDALRIPSADGTSLVLWRAKAREGQPTIVYFHGNGGNLGYRTHLLQAWQDAGFGFVAVDYRGYGGSGGSPEETGILADAQAAVNHALNQERLPASQLIFYGESLGTGIAVRMAATTPPRLLVLQSPYISVAARAAEIYYYVPVQWLIHDRFESLDYLKQVHAPVLILHGETDTVIPITQGRAMLAAANAPKKGIFFPHVGHMDFPTADVIAAMREMLAANPVPVP